MSVPRAQLSFDDLPAEPTHGGRRPGAGRKPRLDTEPRVRHRTRTDHEPSHPVLVTLRAVEGLPSFRDDEMFVAFDRAFRTTRYDAFRIVEFSVLDDHVHLIVEADDAASLASGMKGFSIRANRLFNAASERGRGRVWADRYHERELGSPRQVRAALAHLFEHPGAGGSPRGARSSAPWFDGFTTRAPLRDPARPTEAARTHLLRSAWRRLGLLDPADASRVTVPPLVWAED